MSNSTLDRLPSETWVRSVYRWAVSVAIVTFPLIWIGGLVTTYDAGMAVPDWPGTYGYNLWLYPWTTWLFGPFDLFVEHGHRLLATVVGMLTIGLFVAAYRFEKRRWFATWAFFMLLAVIAQGVLGGFRVLLDARTMAMIHGCTGPLFFALAAVTAVMSSPTWSRLPEADSLRGGLFPKKTPWLVLVLPVFAFCQLVIGAQLRHIQPWTSPSTFMAFVHTHLTLAAVVTLLIGWVAITARRKVFSSGQGLLGPSALLAWLVLFQLALGFGTWICNYALPWSDLTPELAKYTIQAKGFVESWIVTGHQAVGSLIVAVSSVLAVRWSRNTAVSRSLSARSAP